MNNIHIVGNDGALGQALSNRFDVPGTAFSDPEKGEEHLSKALEESPKIVLVVAVAADFQVQVHETIFALAQAHQATPTIVNLNSVQDQVPKILEYRMSDIPDGVTLIGLHPHHGHPLTGNVEKDKRWLLTYAKRWDRNQKKEAATVRMFRTKLEKLLSAKGASDIAIYDFDKAAQALPQFNNGADLHDTLTAYSQALVHMLRGIVDDDDVFFEHFVPLQVNPELSAAIVAQNPYAREGVYRRLMAEKPSQEAPEYLAQLQQLALKFAHEYDQRFDFVPPEIRAAARTPKFNELVQNLAER